MNWYEHPALTGDHVRLEPLRTEHAPGLLKAGADPEVWTWLSGHQPSDLDAAEAMVADVLGDRARLAWALLDHTGAVAGTTSFYEIDQRNRGLYIGHTWIGTPWQRTALNTEAKLLLLTWAFDRLGANRVGWHTDGRNLRSQRAIERLGASREGVLRGHKIRKDGSLRDTVCYGLLAADWPRVRTNLTERANMV